MFGGLAAGGGRNGVAGRGLQPGRRNPVGGGMETERTASGLIAATALVLLLGLIFALSANGAIAVPDPSLNIGIPR